MPWNARNYARMDSLAGLALEGWFEELRECSGWIGGCGCVETSVIILS